MNWLNEFKIAIINHDESALVRLIESFDVSKFQNLEQLEEAAALNLQASTLLKSKQDFLREQMKKLQNVKKYVQV